MLFVGSVRHESLAGPSYQVARNETVQHRFVACVSLARLVGVASVLHLEARDRRGQLQGRVREDPIEPRGQVELERKPGEEEASFDS